MRRCLPTSVGDACRGLLLATVLGVAGSVSAAAGWTGPGRVVELQVDQFGRVLVQLDGVAEPGRCDRAGWFVVENVDGAQRLYRLLVDAALNEMPVDLYRTGACDALQRGLFSRVAVRP